MRPARRLAAPVISIVLLDGRGRLDKRSTGGPGAAPGPPPSQEPTMAAPYRDLLQRVRLAFPQPVSDRVHDSYFVHSIMRALDQVDELKSDLPFLRPTAEPDFAAARQARLRDQGATLEEVTRDLVGYLGGLTVFGHPRTQQNVIAQPSIPSVIGVLLASLYNPNLLWDEFSRRVALAEVEAAAITARLVGYDPERAAGLFTFGGTATTLYGV